MLTKPNPYLQLFFDFLERNQVPGMNHLWTADRKDGTLLSYGCDDKYLGCDIEYLCSLPYKYIYNQVAEEWWQLLQSCDFVNVKITKQGRNATLSAESEKRLYEHVKTLLAGAQPTQVRQCNQLADVQQIAFEFAEELNERIHRQVRQSVSYLRESDFMNFTGPFSLALLSVWNRGFVIGRHEGYEFADGVKVEAVQPYHQRPYSVACIWVELPKSDKAALPVGFSFIDNRQQVVAAQNKVQSEQLMTQWCLEKGCKRLELDPCLREVVERYGVVDAEQPQRRWLSQGQLLVELQTYLPPKNSPVAVSTVAQEDELPF